MLVAMERRLASHLGVPRWTTGTQLLRWRSDARGQGTHPFAPAVDGRSRTVGDALEDIGEIGYVDHSNAVYRHNDFARNARYGEEFLPGHAVPVSPPNHDQRNHGDLVVDRFRLLQAFVGTDLSGARLFELAARTDERDATKVVRNAIEGLGGMPVSLIDTLLGMGYPHPSLHDLTSEIVRLQSLKHSQRPLVASDPAPTIMSLPDDLVHPTCPRTLTVREMARLQSFPDWFVFHGKATTGGRMRATEVPQYTQVGNAVPPLVGLAVGRRIHTLLSREGS